jgi:hypothetical protein
MSDRNCAKVRNIRIAPQGRENLAQGFNSELNFELYTQFVGGNKHRSVVSMNTGWKPMLHCSSERRAIARGHAVKPSPRTRRGDATA